MSISVESPATPCHAERCPAPPCAAMMAGGVTDVKGRYRSTGPESLARPGRALPYRAPPSRILPGLASPMLAHLPVYVKAARTEVPAA